MVAGVGTLAFLCGFATLGGVVLFDRDAATDVKGVSTDVEAVVHLVASGALILAADSVDAVKLVGDLLAVGLLNGAGTSLVLSKGSRGAAIDVGGGQVASAVQSVSLDDWLRAVLVASTAAASAALNHGDVIFAHHIVSHHHIVAHHHVVVVSHDHPFHVFLIEAGLKSDGGSACDKN
jgi:hypothetical protein